jgi:CRP-like cAMP-binding protein
MRAQTSAAKLRAKSDDSLLQPIVSKSSRDAARLAHGRAGRVKMKVGLADYLVSFLSIANVLGVIGAIFHVASMSMKTVIPLRITGIVSACFLLTAAILSRSLPAIVLYALLLPVHSIRLHQMLQLIKKVRAAARSDLSMTWLRPYMKKRKYRKGDILFRKGDPADEMFLVGKGKYRVPELDIELHPGEIFGELGLLTSGYQRTQSVECIEDGHALTIPYDEVRALYFENPEFGFYFLRLSSKRLLEDLARTEAMLAGERQKH